MSQKTNPSLGYRFRKAGLDRIQKILGHQSLSSTGVYVEPTKEDLIDSVESLAR